MAKFMLKTDSVSTVSNGMKTLSGNVDTIIGNVNSYDVSSSEFPFSEAKSAIVSNLQAIKTKVKNTNILLDAVIRVHSDLQESVGNGYDTDTGDTTSTKEDTTTYSSPDTSSNSNSSGNNSNTSGSSNPSSYYQNNNFGGGTGPAEESTDGWKTVMITEDSGSSVSNSDTAAATSSNVNSTLITNEAASKEVAGMFSTFADEYERIYKQYKITEVSSSSLATTVAKGMHLVVEGDAAEVKMIDYLETVGSAAMSYNASIEFVNLGSISATKSSTKVATTEDGTVAYSNSKLVTESAAINVLGTADDKDNATGGIVGEIDSKLEGKLSTSSTEVIGSSSKTSTSELKEINQFKCATGIKMSFETLPITMIIKNNVVVYFKSGYLTEKELKTALAAAERIPLVN